MLLLFWLFGLGVHSSQLHSSCHFLYLMSMWPAGPLLRIFRKYSLLDYYVCFWYICKYSYLLLYNKLFWNWSFSEIQWKQLVSMGQESRHNSIGRLCPQEDPVKVSPGPMTSGGGDPQALSCHCWAEVLSCCLLARDLALLLGSPSSSQPGNLLPSSQPARGQGREIQTSYSGIELLGPVHPQGPPEGVNPQREIFPALLEAALYRACAFLIC